MTSDIKIISFDLDGVLFDGSSAAFAIAQKAGLGEQYVKLFERMAKEGLSLRQSVIEGSKIWRGIPIDGSYDDLVYSLPLMLGAEEVVDTLKTRGYDVGCISSGVSQFFMEPFSRRLNLDFAYSNTLGSNNGAHDGTVQHIMDGPEKAITISEYAKIRGYSQMQIASVGNGRNDIELFKISTFSIAFNPMDSTVAEAASVIIESKDLRPILDYFDTL